MPKIVSFEGCCQSVLPDKSILKGQKMSQNAKFESLKWDISIDFHTLCQVLAKFLTLEDCTEKLKNLRKDRDERK